QSQRQTEMQNAEALIANGEVVAAIDALKRAIKSDPNFYQGWLRLSRLLFDTENYREAVHISQAAERFDPLQSEFQSIQTQMQSGAYGRAEAIARKMLVQQPGHPRAVFTIAEVAKRKNYPEGMVEILEHGLQISPASLFLRNLLIGARDRAGDFVGAIRAARTLVKTEETFVSLWSLVSVLLRHGQNEELLEVCDRAGRASDGDKAKLGEVDLVRGQILRVLGRRDESIAAYRACLENNPSNAGAWWALADMKTFAFTDADSAAIRTLLQTPSLPQSEKCVATFALAKASETEGDWDQTMALYHEANKLHPNATYRSKGFTDEVSNRVAAFDADVLSIQADKTPDGPTPVFILGLPRSGSTLIEQILASHSEIEGTIEQPVMPSIARKAHVKCALEYQGGLLQKAGALTPNDLVELGQSYLDNGALFRTGETRFFTDKLPFNFRHIGLIQKALPNAIIIDARRNPMDCGFSLYKQHFPTGVEFSYGLDHIGAFYVDYLRLMDHWDSLLPSYVLTVQYETLVRDPEAGIRRILEHIGVPFEQACLDFHLTDRAVRTASSEQVRQPINTKGIGAWRKVERHLEPLKTALGAEALSRFEGYYDP
ncbi:MAG: sulfotransferase, partial [Pseudomonadota bacterium]